MPRIVNRRAEPSPVDVKIVASSGNVFADLGFEQPGLELAKARLSHTIATEIAARKLTQRAAAEILGIDQPRVSLLVRGKTGQFSLEKLIELLELLSYDVHIQAIPVTDTAHGHGRTIVSV
jgi:predicted XRE-type DNA-binding protein